MLNRGSNISNIVTGGSCSYRTRVRRRGRLDEKFVVTDLVGNGNLATALRGEHTTDRLIKINSLSCCWQLFLVELDEICFT